MSLCVLSITTKKTSRERVPAENRVKPHFYVDISTIY